jgi:beta-glucanase (GH16 family)
MVWQDEFETLSASDDQISHDTKWTDHLYYGGGNGPLDIPVPSALSVADGALVITAARAASGKYYGGTLSSVNEEIRGFYRQYGYWEIRMKPAKGYNMLTSLYLVSMPHMVQPANPLDPFEIDAIEYNGGSASIAATTVHWYSGGKHYDNGPTSKTNAGVDLSNAYHVYGMEWTPTVIRFFLDGKFTTQVATPPDGHVPMGMFVVLYLGGGATFGTPTSSKAYVDYVRVYAPPS